jgi:GT2 family glycosyltransferase
VSEGWLLTLSVIYATVGRADTVAEALEFLEVQTRRPDQVIISAVGPSDVPEIKSNLPIEVLFGPKGLPAQRNTALKALAADADITVFFDDDFAPAKDYLARVEAIFLEDEEIAGLTGHVIADGIGGPGYTFAEARKFLGATSAISVEQERRRPIGALYGCNMSIRNRHARDIFFDEDLPLYAWQEDIDFTSRIARSGRLYWTDTLVGVHLGIKRARSPGKAMGYSQIANPIFLLNKGTMDPSHAIKLMARNFAANLIKCIRPEPWCDRRGRLLGNFRALIDLTRGRLHPRNILDLK